MADVRKRLQQWLWLSLREGAQEHRSFLVFGNYFFLKLAVLVSAAGAAAYALHDPKPGPGGGTWLGYTLGTIAALLILWLTWFGVRKRRYRESHGQAHVWVSAHVYLGLSLLVIATLHTGFHFSWNIHTLTYVLMLLVIASGIYGVVMYAVLPGRITVNRAGVGLDAMLAEIAALDTSILALAGQIDTQTHNIVTRSVRKARVGGTTWEQLSGNYRRAGDRGDPGSLFLLDDAQGARTGPPAVGERRSQAAVTFFAGRMFDAGQGPRAATLQKLLQAVTLRKALADRVNRDITLRARMNIWLYVHVPLTVGLLAALVAHVFSVFFYW